jgi:hypothetical protein
VVIKLVSLRAANADPTYQAIAGYLAQQLELPVQLLAAPVMRAARYQGQPIRVW